MPYEKAVELGLIPKVKQLCVACPDKKPFGSDACELCYDCKQRLQEHMCPECSRICEDTKTHCSPENVEKVVVLLLFLL